MSKRSQGVGRTHRAGPSPGGGEATESALARGSTALRGRGQWQGPGTETVRLGSRGKEGRVV